MYFPPFESASWATRLRAEMERHPDVEHAPVGPVYDVAVRWVTLPGPSIDLLRGLSSEEMEWATGAIARWTESVDWPRR